MLQKYLPQTTVLLADRVTLKQSVPRSLTQSDVSACLVFTKHGTLVKVKQRL